MIPGERIKGQPGLVSAVNERQAVGPERMNILVKVTGRHEVGGEDAGVDRAVGVVTDQRIQHIFGAAYLIQPVMHKCDFQANLRFYRGSEAAERVCNIGDDIGWGHAAPMPGGARRVP